MVTRKNVRMQPERARVFAAWAALMTVFIGLLFGYTWCRVQCVRTGYEISRTAARRQVLLGLQNDLKVELARLKSPQRIESIARRQLGLATPAPGQMVIVP